MMTENEMVEYFVKTKIAEYEAIKSRNKTFMTLIICAAIVACVYIIFGLAKETKELELSGDNNKAVIQSTLDNGSNIWE